jgi:hypothetical protein
MNPWATAVILPAILEQVKTAGKWQVKTGCLDVLQQLITSAPNQVGQATPDLIPVLAGAVWDTKTDVKKAAKVTLERATKLVDNKDVSFYFPISSSFREPCRIPRFLSGLFPSQQHPSFPSHAFSTFPHGADGNAGHLFGR